MGSNPMMTSGAALDNTKEVWYSIHMDNETSIMDEIEDWAQDFYPDSVILQDHFKEGAIRALELFTVQALLDEFEC